MTGIDSALGPTNFDEMDLPCPTRKTFTDYLSSCKKKDVEKIRWTDAQPTNIGHQRQCNIIRVAFGLHSEEAQSVETIKEAFNRFFSEDMMRLVLTSTNLKIDETLSEQSEKAIIDDTKPYLRARDECELCAVFSLVYFRGL